MSETKDFGLVSIVMPTYNCGEYISEAIESVQSQTYDNWELLIIDDCSEDNTEQIVKRYISDKRIKYFPQSQNLGAALGRNIGLKNASGKYIAFLDSDDLWKRDKLCRQLLFMQDMRDKGYDCFFSCTAYTHVNSAGRPLYVEVKPFRKVGYWATFFLSDPIGNSTVIYEKEHFKNVEVPNIKKRNDYALWLKMMHKGDSCYGLKEPLMMYRVRGNSLSAKKLRLIKYQWRLYRHVEAHSLLISCLGIVSWVGVKSSTKTFQKIKSFIRKLTCNKPENIDESLFV